MTQYQYPLRNLDCEEKIHNICVAFLMYTMKIDRHESRTRYLTNV